MSKSKEKPKKKKEKIEVKPKPQPESLLNSLLEENYKKIKNKKK